MGEAKQSLTSIRERTWFRISSFILFFIVIRASILHLFSYLFGFIGLNGSWISTNLAQNEIGIQILSFVLTELLLVLLSQRKGFLIDFSVFRVTRDGFWRELVSVFSEKYFFGFLAASTAVAISVLLGFSAMESPADWLALIWTSSHKILYQCIEVVLWFLALELFRFPLWSRIAPESSARFQGRLLLIFFQGWLFYLVAWGSQSASDWQILVFCVSVWVSAQILLWSETSWILNGSRNFWPNTVARVAFCSGFVTSLLHVYGMPTAGRHEVSLVYSVKGPILDNLTEVRFDSFLSQAGVLIVMLVLAGILARRSVRALSRLR